MHHLGVLIIHIPLTTMKGAVPKLMSGEVQMLHGPQNHIFFNNNNGTIFLYIPDNYVEYHLLLNIRHPRHIQLHGSSPHFALCIHACLDKFPQHQNGTAGPLNRMAYSPDLTPHDCCTQGMLKEHVYSSKPRDAQENQRRNELVNTTKNKSQRYGGNLKMVPGIC